MRRPIHPAATLDPIDLLAGLTGDFLDSWKPENQLERDLVIRAAVGAARMILDSKNADPNDPVMPSHRKRMKGSPATFTGKLPTPETMRALNTMTRRTSPGQLFVRDFMLEYMRHDPTLKATPKAA